MDTDLSMKMFVDDLNSHIANNYEIIKDVFNSQYGYPALDPIRDEICKCFICGLYQSTITLTNHLLEKSLKFCLGIRYSIEYKKDGVDIKDAFIDGIDKFDNLLLWQSIDAAYKQELITEVQKEDLKIFKNKFRNPYSHANNKIYSGKSVMGKQVSTNDIANGLEDFLKLCFDESLDEEIPLENLPFAQGICQVEIAKEDCYPYFESVDKIIREMLNKIKSEL